MLFHLDQKPLKCEHCDYTCRQKASIRFHMKKKHPELVKTDLKILKPPRTPKSGSAAQSGEKGSGDKSKSIKNDSESAVNDNTVKASDDISTGHPSDSESSNHANQTPLNSPFETIGESQAIRTSLDSDSNVQVKPDTSGKTAAPMNQNSSSSLSNPSNGNTVQSKKSSNENMLQSKKSSNEISAKKMSTSEIPVKKPKKTDMYDFQSEEESEDDMKPGLYFIRVGHHGTVLNHIRLGKVLTTIMTMI